MTKDYRCHPLNFKRKYLSHTPIFNVVAELQDQNYLLTDQKGNELKTLEQVGTTDYVAVFEKGRQRSNVFFKKPQTHFRAEIYLYAYIAEEDKGEWVLHTYGGGHSSNIKQLVENMTEKNDITLYQEEHKYPPQETPLNS